MAKIEQEVSHSRIIDLQAGAHVLVLERGVFCVFRALGTVEADESGLPGVRISPAPAMASGAIEISTFDKDGWITGTHGAALVRVNHDHAGLLVTTYRDPNLQQEGPRLQVLRLGSDNVKEREVLLSEDEVTAEKKEEVQVQVQDIQAHIQRRGDCSVALGSWVGEIGSQAWIEGFVINPLRDIAVGDIEYQAVLGKGWLSPWVECGHFCGSRGMSLPVLGLRVRLKGMAAQKWTLRLAASFTDGTKIDAVENPEDALEAESLAPLEAFLLELLPKEEA